MAIKIINYDPNKLDLCTSEIAYQSELHHPSICELLKAGICSQSGRSAIVLVMDKIKGCDLVDSKCLPPEEVSAKQAVVLKDLTPKDICNIGIQLLEGVRYAHKKGLIHSDLKPENIMLFREDGVIKVKIIDWGLCVTYPNFKMQGTPMYLAPEILSGNRGMTAKTDAFAIGLVLQILLEESEHCGCKDRYFPVSDDQIGIDKLKTGYAERVTSISPQGSSLNKLKYTIHKLLLTNPFARWYAGKALSSFRNLAKVYNK